MNKPQFDCSHASLSCPVMDASSECLAAASHSKPCFSLRVVGNRCKVGPTPKVPHFSLALRRAYFVDCATLRSQAEIKTSIATTWKPRGDSAPIGCSRFGTLRRLRSIWTRLRPLDPSNVDAPSSPETGRPTHRQKRRRGRRRKPRNAIGTDLKRMSQGSAESRARSAEQTAPFGPH